MKFNPLVPLLFTLPLTGVACAQRDTGQAPQSQTPGRAWYAQYCATCHGPNMDGAGASSLIDDNWAFGGEREDIFRSIHDGIEDLGMPAYGGALDEEQINLIIDAILGTEKEPETTATTARQYDTLETLDYDVRVERWVGGLNTPWGIAFIDSDTALVTERPGPLRLVENGTLHPRPIADTPSVTAVGQGGMMAVSIDPDYESNGWIYLGYSHGITRSARTQTQTRIVRGRLDNHRWVDQEIVWEADERHYSGGRVHYGVRIVFDRDGYLYFAIGDRGHPPSAQDLGSPNGKVHRLHRDGSIPDDNPFLDTPGALPSIYSYGHRNPQGLDFHPVTGDLWEAEHGPRGGDEINLVRAGKNYGWPELSHGINYNGTIITRERIRPGMESPIWVWRPSTAVCAIEIYRGNQFPFWRNHLLAGALRNEDLRLLQIENDRIIHEEVILRNRGRIRDVITGPDGAIYLAMNEPDEILRLSVIRENMR